QRVGAWVADHRLHARAHLAEHLRGVHPERVVGAALHVGDRDDLAASIVEVLRRKATYLAETLHRDGDVTRVDAGLLKRLERGDQYAATGRARPALGPTHADGLAGDDTGHGVAEVHRVGVHEPGHRLLVRADVRRWDVLLRPDDRADLAGVAPRDPLELRLAVEPRVDRDATLRPAVRDPDQ